MSGTPVDVLIVGGGVAGCATAFSLARFNPKSTFLVLDDSNARAFKIGESLPPESAQLLHGLDPGLARHFAEDVLAGTHLHCSGNASAWASCDLEDRSSIFNPFGQGIHLDRAAFDELLRQTVLGLSLRASYVSLVKGVFKGIERVQNNLWCIRAVVNGEDTVFLAKWVIDATGRKASVATKLGSNIIVSDQLLAFYALFQAPIETDNDHRTVIEASANGWYYSSLISCNPPTRLVAFHTLPNHPTAKEARRRDGFQDLLHATTSHISKIINSNDYTMVRGAFPQCTTAGSSHLDKACDLEKGWIAVGDAAMAFEPLSSQGMMTSLEMGSYVGAVLARITIDGHADANIEELYHSVREEYQRHRTYYYSIVQRFEGSQFWDKVKHIH